MKRLLLTAFGLLLCASVALGQAGGVGLYFDSGVWSVWCHDDFSSALVPVYVVLVQTPGVTGVQYLVEPGGGFNCSFIGEIVAAPISIGSSLTGMSAAWAVCTAAPKLISTINYFCLGISPACATLTVVPDPTAPSGTIEIVDCTYVKRVGFGLRAYFSPSESCQSFCVEPVEQTSWGRLKALYE